MAGVENEMGYVTLTTPFWGWFATQKLGFYAKCDNCNFSHSIDITGGLQI